MKIHNSTYVFVLTVTALILTSGCRSTKPFTCVWQNPLDYAYDSLIYRDTITVKNIKAFTKHIDSLTENDVSQKFVIESIAEGKITQEIVTNSIVGHNNKIDTVRKTKTGGFGKYTTENIKGDTVYKILYHDNIDKNFYEAHYYKDNKLVYSKIDYQEDGIGQTFYYKEEYYKGDKILLTNESAKSIDTVFRQRVTFDLRKKGNEFLAEFQAKRN
jgi:predicted lactoylglutathione lyase